MRGFVSASACVGLLGSALGCDPAAGPDPLEPDGVTVERAATVDAPVDLAVKRPKKGAVIGGERVQRTISWPAADRIDTETRDRLTAISRERVTQSVVPVLVPRDASERGLVMVGERWYAYTTKIEDLGEGIGATVSVQGSAQARVYPHIHNEDPTYEIRGTGGYVSQNEAIWAISWIENGAAYSLELECDDPRAAACADPARAVELVEGLVFVGGAPDNARDNEEVQ